MRSTGVLIDLEDPDNGLDRDNLPPWLLEVNRAWLLIPLQLQERLVGFVLLKESRAGFDLTWEDYELAKAAGQQAASSLSQMIAFDALSEARQFFGI